MSLARHPAVESFRFTEDRYFDLVDELQQEFAREGRDANIRRIVRREIDQRIAWLIRWALFVATVSWVGREYGPGAAILACVSLLFSYFVWKARRGDFDPKRDRHLITTQAENFVRLQTIKDSYDAGHDCWEIVEDAFDAGNLKVVAAATPSWERFWEHVYDATLEMERLSPRQRQKKLGRAAREAREPILHMEEMAARGDAKPVYWASVRLIQCVPAAGRIVIVRAVGVALG